MSLHFGPRNARDLRVRLLNEEDESARYKREGWDPRKTYEENMGFEGVFDRPEEELEWPSEEAAAPRREPTRQVRRLAAQGRGDDTEIAHVARGEMVVPRALQTPEFMAALIRAAETYGIPLGKLTVGNPANRINPNSGAPEFWLGAGLGPDRGPDSLMPEPEYTQLKESSEGVPASLPTGPSSRQIDLPDINIPPPYQPPANPSAGTMPILREPLPSYKMPGPPGTGAIRLPTEPYSGPQAAHWPTKYEDTVKSSYGPRPEYKDFHHGVDFHNKLNDPVYSVTDGRIEYIGTNPNARSGTYIMVRDASGNLYGYAHSGAIDGLKIGAPVKAGDQIGFSNGSGRTPKGEAVAPHLHMTFRPATPDFTATMATNYTNPNVLFQSLRDRSKR